MVFSYVIVVGEVREAPLDGRIVLRILACCFASFFVSSSCFVRVFRFVCLMVLLSLFLNFACFRMFLGVGSFFRISCSVCCFWILRLNEGSHQVFWRGLGVASWCSIVFCIACWMLVKCCEVVRGCGGWSMFLIAVWVSAMMVSLCLLYLFMDSVLVVFRFCFGMLVLKVVYVGR